MSEESRDADGGEIATRTLADIYAQQGLYDRALEIYRRIQRRAPEDEEIADRIASLRDRLARADEEPDAASTDAGRPSPGGPLEPAEIPVPADGATEEDAAPAAESGATAGPAGAFEAAAARTGPPQSEAEEVAGDEPSRRAAPEVASDDAFLAWLERR